jgi:hypothetical protein
MDLYQRVMASLTVAAYLIRMEAETICDRDTRLETDPNNSHITK